MYSHSSRPDICTRMLCRRAMCFRSLYAPTLPSAVTSVYQWYFQFTVREGKFWELQGGIFHSNSPPGYFINTVGVLLVSQCASFTLWGENYKWAEFLVFLWPPWSPHWMVAPIPCTCSETYTSLQALSDGLGKSSLTLWWWEMVCVGDAQCGSYSHNKYSKWANMRQELAFLLHLSPIVSSWNANTEPKCDVPILPLNSLNHFFLVRFM